MKKLVLFLILIFASHSIADNLDIATDAVFARDYKKAIELLHPLAVQGNADAQLWLGISYRSGRPDKSVSDMEKELYWYLKAAEANNPYALWRLGKGEYLKCQVLNSCEHTDDSLLEKARDEWHRRAEQGNGEAMYNLAIRGLGWKKWIPYYNIAQRHKGLQNAIEHGYYQAAVELALNLEEENKYDEAIDWLRRAAKQGDTKAQHRLSEVLGDEKERFYWAQKAAEQNYGDSLYALGYMYKTGEGVDKDLKKSAFYYCILVRDSGARDQCSMLGQELSEQERAEVTAEVEEWLKHNQAYYPQHPLFY